MLEQYRNGLDEGRPQARASLGMIGNKYTVDWSAYSQVDWTERVQTGVELRAAARRSGSASPVARRASALHPRVAQLITNRQKMLAGELPLDWGCAETLAYASLIEDGFARAYHRPGQRTRHLLPSPRGAARPEHRCHLDPAAAHRASRSRACR